MTYADLMSNANQIQQQLTQLAMGEAEQQRNTGRETAPMSPAQQQAIADQYADVPSLFQPYADLPDPQDYQSGVDTYTSIMQSICVSAGSAADPIDSGQLYIGNTTVAKVGNTDSVTIATWNGVAADAFRRNFLGPFNTRGQNLFVLAGVLKAGLEAEQHMWAAARDNIDKIATGTLDVLDNQGSCDQNGWNITFTVISSLAAVGAAVVTDGASLALTAVAATAQAAAVVPPPSLSKNYQGATADQINANMRDAINILAGQITDRTNLMTTRLQTASDFVTQHASDFVAPRPSIDDMSDDTLTHTDGLGHP